MKVLITGANGLLGQKLATYYANRFSVRVVATGRGENRNPIIGDDQYFSLDITSEKEVSTLLNREKPDVVINTAAMTEVDQCEKEKERCRQLNVTAVEYVKNACEKTRSFLIQLSTDFVFDGETGLYREEDTPNPLNYYAKSKLASEKVLEKSSLRYAIVRTMLVYGMVQNMSRSNIILWVKKNLEEGNTIKVVNDQWRMPTLVEDLVHACTLVIEKQLQGIFHISGKDLLNPYQMAVKTASVFKLDETLIEEVDGSFFTQAAKRPPKTGFILDKAGNELGYEPTGFEEGLAMLKSQLNGRNRQPV